jgi:hypothetical protein
VWQAAVGFQPRASNSGNRQWAGGNPKESGGISFDSPTISWRHVTRNSRTNRFRTRLALQSLDDRIVPDGTPITGPTSGFTPGNTTPTAPLDPIVTPVALVAVVPAAPTERLAQTEKEARLKVIDTRLKEVILLVADLDKNIADLDKNTKPLKDAEVR